MLCLQGVVFDVPSSLEAEIEVKIEYSDISIILDSSISSKLFSLEVQKGSSLIDPVLLQEET